MAQFRAKLGHFLLWWVIITFFNFCMAHRDVILLKHQNRIYAHLTAIFMLKNIPANKSIVINATTTFS